MNKTLLALTLILATAFADLANLDLSTSGALTASLGIAVNGAASGDVIGTKINYVGDFNGDTYPDYVVAGAAAKIYVILGKSQARVASINLGDTASNLASAGVVPITVTGGANLVVNGAGDVNNDNLDDIIIGWPSIAGLVSGGNTAAANAGMAIVVFGRGSTDALTFSGTTTALNYAAGTANSGVFVIRRLEANDVADDAFGTAVGPAGDIDGDGIDDFVVTMPEVAASGKGKVYIFRGKTFDTTGTLSTTLRKADIDPDTLTNGEGFSITGESNALRIGLSVANLGDIDGDNHDDIVVGATNRAYIVYGSVSTATVPFATLDLSTDLAKTTYITGTSGEGIGANVASAGDFNGDGRRDVILNAAAVNPGKVYVVFGKTTSTSSVRYTSVDLTTLGTKGVTITGITAEKFGTDSDGVGDVNNDGVDDIVIGAPHTTGIGKVYVVFGSTSIASLTVDTLSPSSSGIVIKGATAGDTFGTSVSRAGNLNRDSAVVEDFLVGAPAATSTAGNPTATSQTTGGIVYEFYGIAKTPTGSGFRLGASLLVLVGFFVALIF